MCSLVGLSGRCKANNTIAIVVCSCFPQWQNRPKNWNIDKMQAPLHLHTHFMSLSSQSLHLHVHMHKKSTQCRCGCVLICIHSTMQNTLQVDFPTSTRQAPHPHHAQINSTQCRCGCVFICLHSTMQSTLQVDFPTSTRQAPHSPWYVKPHHASL